MNVRDVIMRDAVTVDAGVTVSAAAELMSSAGVGALIVVDHDVPVGVVTDRDIVTRGVARGVPLDGRVDALMSMGVVAVDADAELAELLQAFGRHAVRRIPVVEADRVIGVVALDDLLVSTVRDLDRLARVVAAQIMFPHAGDAAPVPVPV